MMYDYRRRRLLRIEHEFIRQLNTDPLRLQQFEQLCLVSYIRTRRVAEAVARSLIALVEKLRKLRCVIARKPQLFADPLVPQFRQRLSRFDRQAVKQKVILIIVRGE